MSNWTADFAKYVLDGNDGTAGAAGDDAWASRFYIDFGEVKYFSANSGEFDWRSANTESNIPCVDICSK